MSASSGKVSTEQRHAFPTVSDRSGDIGVHVRGPSLLGAISARVAWRGEGRSGRVTAPLCHFAFYGRSESLPDNAIVDVAAGGTCRHQASPTVFLISEVHLDIGSHDKLTFSPSIELPV